MATRATTKTRAHESDERAQRTPQRSTKRRRAAASMRGARAAEVVEAATAKSVRAAKKTGERKTKTVTYSMPAALINELRRATLFVQKVDPSVSMSKLVIYGIGLVIAEIEEKLGPVPSGAPPRLKRGARKKNEHDEDGDA